MSCIFFDEHQEAGTILHLNAAEANDLLIARRGRVISQTQADAIRAANRQKLQAA